jgi:hypothetical protein
MIGIRPLLCSKGSGARFRFCSLRADGRPIGPQVRPAKNRFYQVPHCNGGGYRDPSAAAAMRGIKAEGGWG